MHRTTFPVEKFSTIKTPFYYYDIGLLRITLDELKKESEKYNYFVHYAVKANANKRILNLIHEYGFGADCVSGNEVKEAHSCGFAPENIVFAGVGKSDEEINISLDLNIRCFNVESIEELEVLNELAGLKKKTAPVALRINPNVDPNTHKYITTGLEENKFGINWWDIEEIIGRLPGLANIELTGLHFHIGSQISTLDPYIKLCNRVNEIQDWFSDHKIKLEHINVGGGMGIDYENPDINNIPDFAGFFKLFKDHLKLRDGQQLHFELGRSVIAQSGNLISKVLYIKEGVQTNFAILDAGMTDLLRPALYQAYHKIENLSSTAETEKYDVVGPICESSDCFGKAIKLPKTRRGDLMALRSAGAYGEVMANRYNLRDLPKALYSDDL